MKEINEKIIKSVDAAVLLAAFLSALDKEQLKEAKKWQNK